MTAPEPASAVPAPEPAPAHSGLRVRGLSVVYPGAPASPRSPPSTPSTWRSRAARSSPCSALPAAASPHCCAPSPA
ncbi:hypothetical protein [Actinomyces ruminis]|uniref:hypothetical protein n=1 Tax=Actinomyces ruminis TaxID=1937003 RepID=UPI0015D46EE7|nr:hypothetical protein [Actinomyces ruminis]